MYMLYMQNDDDDDDDDDVSTLELEQSASVSCRYYPTSYFNQSINQSINGLFRIAAKGWINITSHAAEKLRLISAQYYIFVASKSAGQEILPRKHRGRTLLLRCYDTA